MRKYLVIACSLIIAVFGGKALADLSYTQGVGTTIFDFICFTSKHCSAHVNIDSTGAEKGTSGNPLNTAAAAGALASGAGVDGWNITEGTKADVAWSSGSGSLVAVGKAVATNTAAAVPAGTNNIGKIDILGNAGGTLDGTAGSPATQVLTVQGVAGSTQVNVGNYNDPCASAAKSNFALASAAGNVQVVAGSASKKVYVCSISIVPAAGAVVNVIEGTGAACTTANEAAVIGSTTAANGMSLGSNGIFILGNGGNTIAQTATTANGICILQSGTVALAGNVTYVQQ